MLELRSVSAGYDDLTVLREVNLLVPSGSVVALLGANGAGKTTLLRTASGLIRPKCGAVVFEGRDVTAMPLHKRARLGICHIPEGRGIFPALSVRENLIVFSPAGNNAAAFDAASAAFPILGARLEQIAGSLSGGEQQMLAVVRAYVSDAKVVLVDEASLGLAPTVVDGIFEFLRKMAGEGRSILIVEQYIQRALDLAETVYLLNQGEIVFVGGAADIRASDVIDQYLGVAVDRGPGLGT